MKLLISILAIASIVSVLTFTPGTAAQSQSRPRQQPQPLGRWFYRKFLEHPASQHWFGRGQFIAELEQRGIVVGENVVERCFGDFVVGVGRRVSPQH
ncbi:MAG: hypothetical protein ACREA9_01165 [Pyrinomonadaceae bacterium]